MTEQKKTQRSGTQRDMVRILIDFWLKENDIKTNKLMMFFLVQSILVGSLVFAGEIRWITALLGTLFSLIWYFCIGRTVAYQKHWKRRIEGILDNDAQLFPSHEEEAQFPLYGKIPTRIILLWPPLAGFVLWLVALTAW